MTDDRIARLTDKQRQCLRLVNDGMESKDIAAVMGLSPHTVDGHLRNALRILGVSRRRAAGRLLAAHEQNDQSLRDAPLSVASPTVSLVAEDPIVADFLGVDRPESGSTKGRPRNDLTTSQRLQRIGTAAMKVTAFVAALMLVMYVLQRVGQAVGFR